MGVYSDISETLKWEWQRYININRLLYLGGKRWNENANVGND